jgi:hypothetical protein
MKRALNYILGISLAIDIFVILANFVAVAPVGTHFFLAVDPFFILPLLLALPAIPLSTLGLFWRKHRGWSLTVLLASLIFMVVLPAGLKIGFMIRYDAFVRLAQRSQPLISAIRQFEAKYGNPPADLESLVPAFLDEVPQTGIGAYPNYEYTVASPPGHLERNPWGLTVKTPVGILGWDIFVYLPDQNYPRTAYGGVIERVEGWAYVHE